MGGACWDFCPFKPNGLCLSAIWLNGSVGLTTGSFHAHRPPFLGVYYFNTLYMAGFLGEPSILTLKTMVLPYLKYLIPMYSIVGLISLSTPVNRMSPRGTWINPLDRKIVIFEVRSLTCAPRYFREVLFCKGELLYR